MDELKAAEKSLLTIVNGTCDVGQNAKPIQDILNDGKVAVCNYLETLNSDLSDDEAKKYTECLIDGKVDKETLLLEIIKKK